MKLKIILLMTILSLFFAGCSNLAVNPSNTDSIGDMIVNVSNNAIITQTYAHHEIHEGDHYYIDDKTTLGNGGTRNILFKTPTCNYTKYVHLISSATSSGIITTFALYENSTISVLGTPIIIHNRNRVLNYVSLSTGYINPTITNTGTIISDEHWGVKEKQGGGQRGQEEILLACGTNYLIRVISGEASNLVNINLDWYENGLEN